MLLVQILQSSRDILQDKGCAKKLLVKQLQTIQSHLMFS